MPKDEVLIKISAYVDGELSSSERREVETALESNPEYREAARAFRELDALGTSEVPSVSADDWNRVWNRLREEVLRTEPPAQVERTSAALLTIRRLVPLAAAALLIFGVVWLGKFWDPRDDSPAVVEPTPKVNTSDPNSSNPDQPVDPKAFDKTATLDDEDKEKTPGDSPRKDL